MNLILFLIALASAGTHVVMETNKGQFELELYDEKAPQTVKNFLSYVDDKFYDGTIFHRVIDNFMIQGGGFDSNFQEKATKAPIKNEASTDLKNESYTVAMARTMDPHSATAQFFINVKDNSFLDHKFPTAEGWGYAVFGRVVSGTPVINTIKKVATKTNGPYADVPVENIIIQKAYRK